MTWDLYPNLDYNIDYNLIPNKAYRVLGFFN